jgi:hypothetical protein
MAEKNLCVSGIGKNLASYQRLEHFDRPKFDEIGFSQIET